MSDYSKSRHVWAVIADGEGIVAYLSPPYPLVALNEGMVPQLQDMAAEVARLTGKKLRLVRFDRAEEVACYDLTPQQSDRGRLHIVDAGSTLCGWAWPIISKIDTDARWARRSEVIEPHAYPEVHFEWHRNACNECARRVYGEGGRERGDV